MEPTVIVTLKAVVGGEARGCHVVDVSEQKCGSDTTSCGPAANGKVADARHIEVKGRIKGAHIVTVSLHQALVEEGGNLKGSQYLRDVLSAEPGWGLTSGNFDINKPLIRATPQ